MKQRIEIRSLKRTDKKELSRLLRRQEGYDEFFSEEKDTDTLAKAVAERSLSTCTFGEAAFVDGRMVGAIVVCGWPDGRRYCRKQDKEERHFIKNAGKILLFTAENEKEKPGCPEMFVRAGEDGKRDAERKQNPVFQSDVVIPDAAPVSEHTDFRDPIEPLGGLREGT